MSATQVIQQSNTSVQHVDTKKTQPKNSKAQPEQEQHDSNPVFAGNFKTVLWFLETLWLFTCSDLPTVVVPWATYGLCTAYAGPPLTTEPIDRAQVLANIPRVFTYMWLNLLAFNISNQRLPTAVSEDSINKSWRPLPSQRISVEQAQKLLMYLIPVVYILCLFLGGREASMATMLLAWMYNDLGGAKDHFVPRYLLNAFGMGSWAVGSAMVAYEGTNYQLTNKGILWLATPGLICLVTIHLMDLRDQEGDRATQRSTLPLVFGDLGARIAVIASVLGSSAACIAMWPDSLITPIPTLVFGLMISYRVLFKRTPEDDEKSWRIWGPWLVSIFFLPAVNSHLTGAQ